VPVIGQLSEFHETRRGWLGVRIQPVDETIADSLNLGTARGALIAGVDEKGPAKPAGLMAGDVIVKFDGKEVKESRDLPRLVASMAVGKQVEVLVIRSGKEVTKTVTLGRLEDGEKKVAVATENDDTPKMDAVTKALGMEFSALSDEARKTFKIKDSVKGVIVTSVEPGSAAAERGLRRGDVIEEVNHQAVEHPRDIAKAVEGAKADAKKPALLLVSNGEGEVRFVAVPVD
jgi:serine protease Do